MMHLSTRGRTRLLLGTLSLLAGVAGCSKPSDTTPPPIAGPSTKTVPPATDKRKVVIGVSLLTLTNPFFKVMGDAMKAEGDKNNFDVQVLAGEFDPARQKDQVNDFIVKKVAAIILSPCDSRSIGTTIQEANKAGIPVFTADIASLDKTAKVVSHIATDNYAGGKLAGQEMIAALGGKGKVAIIDHPEVESVILRTKGFHEVVDANKGIQIVAQLPGGGQSEPASKTTQDILEKNPQLDGIFAINDPSALGANAAIEKAGRAGKIKIIGFDGAPEAKQAVKAGKITSDIVQYPEKIGQMTIQAIVKYLAGEQVPAQQLIPAGAYRKADADKDPSLK
jgi:ribose transport system substrate-binding protein